jgi:hypothetical protein
MLVSKRSINTYIERALKMERVQTFFKILVSTFQSAQRHNLEQKHRHHHRRENLAFHKIYLLRVNENVCYFKIEISGVVVKFLAYD